MCPKASAFTIRVYPGNGRRGRQAKLESPKATENFPKGKGQRFACMFTLRSTMLPSTIDRGSLSLSKLLYSYNERFRSLIDLFTNMERQKSFRAAVDNQTSAAWRSWVEEVGVSTSKIDTNRMVLQDNDESGPGGFQNPDVNYFSVSDRCVPPGESFNYDYQGDLDLTSSYGWGGQA